MCRRSDSPAVVDKQRTRRRALYYTTDICDNSRHGWAGLMHRHGYHPIGRYLNRRRCEVAGA